MDVLAFFSWANGMKNEEGINAGVMKGRPNDICGGWVASLVEGPRWGDGFLLRLFRWLRTHCIFIKTPVQQKAAVKKKKQKTKNN